MATTNDLKNGMTLNIDGNLWNVVEFQHVKPGKGGAFVRTKLKNVLSGKVVDRTFNAGMKVDVASVDKREMQYLYREGDDFVFMDLTDYDQPRIPSSVVGDAAKYLLEEQSAVIAFNEGTPLYVDLPAAVELTIAQTERMYTDVNQITAEIPELTAAVDAVRVASEFFEIQIRAQVDDSLIELASILHRSPNDGTITLLTRDFGKTFRSRFLDELTGSEE